MTRARDFEGFYAENFRVLTTQLYAYCGNLTDAQDVVQEACLRALARWPQVSSYEDPAGWVRRVAWNLATSQWRKARRARSVLSQQLSVTDSAIPLTKLSPRGQDSEGFSQDIAPFSLLPRGLGVSVTDPLAGLFDDFAAELAPRITVPAI